MERSVQWGRLTMNHQTISTRVSMTSEAVDVSIHDPRDESVAALTTLNEAQQGQLVHEAWLIGFRAVLGAHRLAEEARLKDIGQTLLSDVDQQLREHCERQEKLIHDALARHFDPESGQLSERLRQLTAEGGTLTNLLGRHIGPQNSVLVETLVKHVGEQSPLFRKLSPTDSEGLLHLMSDRLRQVMDDQSSELKKALDPEVQDGALGRFIVRLRGELKRAEDDKDEQLKIALAALDTTKEDSLLNQMRSETQLAREQLLRAINPAAEGSPLSIIQQSLTERLEQFAKSQKEQLEEAQKLSECFQRDVRDAITRIEARKREDSRSNRGGSVFEDAVLDFVQQCIGATYLVENVGARVGIIKNCKTGDAVVGFPSDSAFHGSRLVVEAKRDKSYTVSEALTELAEARANRDAGVGVFVMAKSHATAGFPTFARYGHDVLVVWDPENPATDPFLQGALMVGLALALRHRTTAAEGDLQALQKIEQRIVKEVERLKEISDAADKIKAHAEKIQDAVRTGHKNLGDLVEGAKKTLLALKVELQSDDEERASPIAVTLPANDGQAVPTPAE